jgi:acyl-CoA thioester hydrolase
MKDLAHFKFKLPLQLRWADLDALGHVNNAIFITYFEVARGHYMLQACPGWDWHKHMFLIGNVEAHFKKELLLTALNPLVYMRTAKIGTKSFVLEYAVVSEKDGETVIHATGSTTQIMFDMKTRTTIEVADWVRENLDIFENSTH